MEDVFKKFEGMMNKMQKTMDNMLEDFGRPRQVSLLQEGEDLPTGYRKPYLDIIEKENEIIAKFELPGVEKDDIQINLSNDRIEISTDTKKEREEIEEGYIYKERRQDKYYRSVLLPTGIDPDNSTAGFQNGILEIKMPKMEITKKKSLKIE